jgi:D-threo-aldose 1-dehydrogenase
MIDPIAKRLLGRTKVAVSRLGVGGGSAFARAGAKGPSLLDVAWNAGLRHFDTAPLYGEGASERSFGAALHQHPREAFVLSTKVGRNGERSFDYSAQGVRASLAQSCARLQLAQVDLAQIHDVDPDLHGAQFEQRFDEAMNGAYAALAAMRSEGTLGAVGMGLKNWDVALRMLRAGQFDCVMLAGGYTLLQQGSLNELLPWCSQHDVSVLVAAPFNTGILATGAIAGARYYYQPAPPEILERTRAIEVVCARYTVPLAAAALQFPLHHPAVASVVVGHERPEEVARNLALLRHPIPSALWGDLKHNGLLPMHAPTPE